MSMLAFALPLCLRYQIDREYGLWLIPLGGLWGIAPDLHNIAPVLQTQLFGLHNSPWVDLFGLHYTLDRPIVRQQYLPSVFASILVFCLAVAIFWLGFRAYDGLSMSHRDLHPAVISGVSTVAAAGYATLVMAVMVGLQDGFRSVALLVDSKSLIVGGLLLIPLGIGLGVVTTLGLEGLVESSFLANPPTAALLGGGFGMVIWLVGIVVLLPLWLGLLGTSVSVPFIHWGSLLVCSVFGVVFGGIYGVVRGALRSVRPRQLGDNSVDSM